MHVVLVRGEVRVDEGDADAVHAHGHAHAALVAEHVADAGRHGALLHAVHRREQRVVHEDGQVDPAALEGRVRVGVRARVRVRVRARVRVRVRVPLGWG